MKKQERSSEILQRLQGHFPEARCELHAQTPFQLLVATILSAQCTDVQVNKVTPRLFAKFPTPKALMEASLPEVENLVRTTGFYRTKAKNIMSCSSRIVTDFGGKVPKTMEDLISLPGVGRKTANVVLGNAFGIQEGVVVDTHVKRIAGRLGLTKHSDPEKIESDLQKLFPRGSWTLLPHLLIFLGRRICSARKPKCQECPLQDICPKVKVRT